MVESRRGQVGCCVKGVFEVIDSPSDGEPGLRFSLRNNDVGSAAHSLRSLTPASQTPPKQSATPTDIPRHICEAP